ncbi:MAG: glucuronate isomerase [Candidatus Cyclobacteriaceae bacterium M3_2C_046]
MTNLIKTFLNSNFLLQNSIAERLYHEVATELPIVDFHNHLPIHDIAADRQFNNITQLWITGDPYKHRLMRMFGIPENEITGDAPDEAKFKHWAKILPFTLGNPLYHWSALELKRVFDIDELLNENNAEEVWQECNQKLQLAQFSAANITKQFKPEYLITSDNVLDDISRHSTASAQLDNVEIVPSLRGDDLLNFKQINFSKFLSNLSPERINDLADYQQIIINYLEKFHQAGCTMADHALDAGFAYIYTRKEKAMAIFAALLAGKTLDKQQELQLKSYLLHFLGKEYAARNWVLQLHIGAHRNTSTRLAYLTGGAGGFAGIGNSCDISSLINIINDLEKENLLPHIILYTLNPNDYEAVATLTGSFAEDGLAGKIQLGPAWWYNDHQSGIERHLDVIANYGVLSQFIGMTTDSRSILSLSRHEYFRRIFCNYLGKMVQQKMIPNDFDLLSQVVTRVCHSNSKSMILNEK